MNVHSVFCVVCSLTFTDYEYETTNACPYCGNDDEALLLDINDDIDGVELCDES
jgi:hypothetical protein